MNWSLPQSFGGFPVAKEPSRFVCLYSCMVKGCEIMHQLRGGLSHDCFNQDRRISSLLAAMIIYESHMFSSLGLHGQLAEKLEIWSQKHGFSRSYRSYKLDTSKNQERTINHYIINHSKKQWPRLDKWWSQQDSPQPLESAAGVSPFQGSGSSGEPCGEHKVLGWSR